jgi:hypothetical protein
MAIPLSNNYKVSHSIDKQELQDDIDILNTGYSVFNQNNQVKENDREHKFYITNQYGNYKSDNYKVIKVNTLNDLAQDYKNTHNKYADHYSQMEHSNAYLVSLALSDEKLPSEYNGWRSSVSYKINNINRMHQNGWYLGYTDSIAIMVLAGFLAMFALLVWIFKQIFWKHYVFGLVSMFLTPMFIAIIGLIFFEIFRFEEDTAFMLVFLTYFIFAVKVIVSLGAKERNNSAIVMAMYLQLALPFLPVFILASSNSRFRYLEDNMLDVYIVSWIVGLLSIAAFKYVYKRLSILPSRK